MNIQELIEKFEARRIIIGNFQGQAVYWEDIKQIFEELDEPEKVTIPQFVADIIEEYKDKGAPIIDIFTEKYSNKRYNTWLVTELNAYDRVARAWLDGYEVEKEKRYTVVMKATKQPLYYNAVDKKLFFSMGGLATNFTQEQLEEAGFGWVFDCEGVEVEEVEE